MFTTFERTVAARYLRSRKGERFVSIIALFSLIGIALGVATLIVVTSVMSGFQTALVARALGVNGHVTIEARAGDAINAYQPLLDRVRAVPGVTSVLPVLDGQVGIRSTPESGIRGALVRGVTPEDLRKIPAIAGHIIAGSLDNFTGDDAIAVGLGIAASYGLGVGSDLTLISAQSSATAFGSVPRSRPYKVVAIFDAGLSDYNNGVIFLPMPMAQIFFQKPDAITGFQLRVADPDHVEDVMPDLGKIFAGKSLLVRDWRHSNDQIIAILQVQKDTMFIVLGMIVLVAAFNVISSLIMLVKDKRADIAIMRTLGASRGAVLRIFLMCGAFVGVSGTVIGTALGLVICRNIVAIQHAIERMTGGQVFDSSVFMLTALPNTIDWEDVTKVVALALILSLLATLYPSWRAAKTDPVEALRNV
jgi:lipoprotein-releasing system permease protein